MTSQAWFVKLLLATAISAWLLALGTGLYGRELRPALQHQSLAIRAVRANVAILAGFAQLDQKNGLERWSRVIDKIDGCNLEALTPYSGLPVSADRAEGALLALAFLGGAEDRPRTKRMDGLMALFANKPLAAEDRRDLYDAARDRMRSRPPGYYDEALRGRAGRIAEENAKITIEVVPILLACSDAGD